MNPVIAIGAIGAFAFAGVALIMKAVRAVEAEDARVAAFRAANGWSFDETANELVGGFDRNEDGRLVFDVIKGVRALGESTRQTSNRWSEPVGGLLALGLPAGTRVIRESVTTHTIEPMLRRADTNVDGIVTREELLQLMRTYDADANGRLSSSERARAMGELASVVADTRTRTIGLDIPKPRPKPVSAPTPAPKPPVVVVPSPKPATPPADAPKPEGPPAPGSSSSAASDAVAAPAH